MLLYDNTTLCGNTSIIWIHCYCTNGLYIERQSGTTYRNGAWYDKDNIIGPFWRFFSG